MEKVIQTDISANVVDYIVLVDIFALVCVTMCAHLVSLCWSIKQCILRRTYNCHWHHSHVLVLCVTFWKMSFVLSNDMHGISTEQNRNILGMERMEPLPAVAVTLLNLQLLHIMGTIRPCDILKWTFILTTGITKITEIHPFISENPNTSFETPDKIICLFMVLTIDRRPTSFKFCQPLPQNHNPYAKLRSQQSCDMRQALKGCGYAWNLAAAWCNYHQTNLSLYHVIPGRKKQPQFDYQLLPVLLVEVHISFWFSFLAHTPEL